jgi:hypothetical protein
MALRAIDVSSLDTPTRVAPRTTLATVTPIAPAPRMVALGAARRERRRWFALGVLFFLAPLAACLGVLEVVR